MSLKKTFLHIFEAVFCWFTLVWSGNSENFMTGQKQVTKSTSIAWYNVGVLVRQVQNVSNISTSPSIFKIALKC